MEFGPVEPLGKFPHRFTQDDRFQYSVKVQPVAGHLEFYVRAADTRLPAMAAERAFHGFNLIGRTRSAPVADESKRLDNQLRAAQRAQRRIRLLCMEAGVDRLFTFTTRGLLTRDQLLSAWDRFRRVAEGAYPEFRYVATIENHKSGQLHIHAGLRGFYCINHLRRLWQSALNRVLGRDQSLIHGSDSPGTVNIPKTRTRKRYAGVQGTIAIAGYIAKYVGKQLTADFNRKKYLHSKNVVVKPSVTRWLSSETLWDALVEAARRFGFTDRMGDAKFFGGSAFVRVGVSDLDPPPF